MPGEVATVQETKTKGRTRFGGVVSLQTRSPERVEPPCPYVQAGCGGCDWQHIDPAAQSRYKRDIVVDALTRIGKITDAESIVRDCLAMSNTRYRSSARILANSTSWGFRAAHSHTMVPVNDCLVLHSECVQQAHDAMGALDGDVDEVHEAHVRRAPDVFQETRLAVSQKSFFQGHIDAPRVLSDLILARTNELRSGQQSLICVDLYSGVGVFSLALARAGHHVISVEGNPYAVGDAHKNLIDCDATVIHSDVKKFRFDVHAFGKTCDVVVVDPSREGIAKEALDAVTSCNARRIILVSCDPAAGARDIALLEGAGYSLTETTPIDMFGHTHHVEMVSILDMV